MSTKKILLQMGKPKNNVLLHNLKFSISYKKNKMRINHKVLKWKRTCLAVEYRIG